MPSKATNGIAFAAMVGLSRDDVAEKSGTSAEYVDRLIELGIVRAPVDGAFSGGDVRRVLMARSIDDSGIPLEGLAAAIERGDLSLDFLDAAAYERFSALGPETFRQVADRTGIPIELLMVIREAMGMPEPSADDRLRQDEMEIVPFIEIQLTEGFPLAETERLLRVQGESTRRIAEQESAWWAAAVIEPALANGHSPEDLTRPDLANRTAPLSEQAILAMYHAQQARVWTATLIEGFEVTMARAGLHSRLERPPAVCFLDVTGYTRLTQERGDEAAAALAATVGRIVRRSSVEHGGKPIKWLGDGVMLLFRECASGVTAALEMLRELSAAGLPPAHVGLHAGPVLYQEGDYFGQTVNIAARIAEFARPGEVLVSEAVADASASHGALSFQEIGPIELKGVAGAMRLLRAATA